MSKPCNNTPRGRAGLAPDSTGARHATLRGITVAATAALLLSACAVPVTRTSRVLEGSGQALMVAPSVTRYGTVVRIEEIDTRVGNSGGGAVLGALIGGVVGNQIGHGTGRAAATALGLFGGAAVGDNTERANAAAASGTIYRVQVRFDDGSERRFDYSGLGDLHNGSRVRLAHGQLSLA